MNPGRKRGRRGSAVGPSLLLTFIAILAVPFGAADENAHAQGASGNCSPNTNPSPSPIAPGQSTKFNVYFYCIEQGPIFIADPITVEMTGLPNGVTFEPMKSTADTESSTGTTFTIKTKKSTPVGTINFSVTAKGQTCATYSDPCQESFKVAPVIMCSANSPVCPDVWWFNGASPQPGQYHTVVEAIPADGEDYEWEITDGSEFAQFSNGGTKIDTGTDNTVRVFPNQDPDTCGVSCVAAKKTPAPGGGSTAKIKVKVKTKQGTASSDDFQLNGKRPKTLQMACIDDKSAHLVIAGTLVSGYRTNIGYFVYDQDGKPLPKKVPSNEQFASGINRLNLNAVWARGPATHLDPIHGEPGGTVEDFFGAVVPIGNSNRVASTFPACIASSDPCLSNAGGAIDQWGGFIYVGSKTPGQGVAVQKHTWERFQDHARHCYLYTPPDGSPIPGCVVVNQFCPPPY
jgi:hypothetical protein